MSARLFLLERYLPGPIRRQMFHELVRLTADAFAAPAFDVRGLGSEEAVAAFGRFTRDEAQRALAGGTAECAVIHDRLYRNARQMGTTIRRRLGIDSPAEAMRALRLLYRAIGIELAGDARRNEVRISRCAFSHIYAPEVCAFVSALDGGIADGITGGATLVFTERITEGAPCCRARLSEEATR